MRMRIGITERGDASIDYSWVDKVSNIDGAILITKNLTDKFIQTVVNLHNSGTRLIVHATCTGLGGTTFEPNVHGYKWQLTQLKKLIDAGFPASHCVLRIDPIFPSEQGLRRVCEVLHEFEHLSTGVTRIRISVYDEYRHVKERLKANGYQPCYGNRFYASNQQMSSVAHVLSRFPYRFEVCAEDILAQNFPQTFEQIGCVSTKDLTVLGIKTVSNLSENGQKRNGCHCLTCKTELLANKFRCPNQCIYCYWRDR